MVNIIYHDYIQILDDCQCVFINVLDILKLLFQVIFATIIVNIIYLSEFL